jgi:hypothetical protein
VGSKQKQFFILLRKSRNHGEALNEFIKLFDSPKDIAINKSPNIGISEHGITYALVSLLWGSLIINMETILKTSLLFFLKEEQGLNKSMTLGQLIKTIKDISPNVGQRLDNIIERKLRNTIAHGSFWFESGKVFLSENSHLNKVKEMPLYINSGFL